MRRQFFVYYILQSSQSHQLRWAPLFFFILLSDIGISSSFAHFSVKNVDFTPTGFQVRYITLIVLFGSPIKTKTRDVTSVLYTGHINRLKLGSFQHCAFITLMYRALTVLILEIVIPVSWVYIQIYIKLRPNSDIFGTISYDSRNLDDNLGNFFKRCAYLDIL